MSARPAAAAEELAADKNLAAGRVLEPRRSTRTTAPGAAEPLDGSITCCLRVEADGGGTSTERH
ncbi:MAG: hypothetical protein LBV60_09035, partial [Streptomyces sp.]|nr:hypothetical protein [Streptomyces sp.]